MSKELQRQLFARLGLDFVCANVCNPGGPDVRLKPPTMIRCTGGDGNCLFRALSYAVTGSENQYHDIRCLIVQQYNMLEINCW